MVGRGRLADGRIEIIGICCRKDMLAEFISARRCGQRNVSPSLPA
jgi:hypothetical protein